MPEEVPQPGPQGRPTHLTLTPPPPPTHSDLGEGHVEHPEGHPKGGEDGEKTELNGDPLGTIMSVPTSRSKEATKSLFLRHSARHRASVSKGYQDQAKDRERLRVPYGRKKRLGQSAAGNVIYGPNPPTVTNGGNEPSMSLSLDVRNPTDS